MTLLPLKVTAARLATVKLLSRPHRGHGPFGSVESGRASCSFGGSCLALLAGTRTFVYFPTTISPIGPLIVVRPGKRYGANAPRDPYLGERPATNSASSDSWTYQYQALVATSKSASASGAGTD